MSKLSLLFTMILMAQSAFAMVFETDKRKDMHEIANPHLVKLARSVFTFIPKEKLAKRSDGHYEFKQKLSLRELINLCPEEKFANQISVGTRCTGFLIGGQKALTAGHCVSSPVIKDFCSKYYLIFDYHTDAAGNPPLSLPADSVVECRKIAKLVFDPTSEEDDYAVLELNRSLRGREPLKIRSGGKIKDASEIVMIGYPRGTTEKVSFGGKVGLNTKPTAFATNLDCFRGNSGSPVLNAVTLEVEGIFVRGQGTVPGDETDPELIGDFVKQPKSCTKTLICKQADGCDATMEALRITRVSF